MAWVDGVHFDEVTETTATQWVISQSRASRGGWVVTPNVDIMARASSDASLAKLVRSADLCVADGMPIVWASRLAGQALPGRVAGSALVFLIAEAAEEAGRSLFLLGGGSGVAQEAATRLATRFPGLRIAGTYSPPLGFAGRASEVDAIRGALRRAQPDIVYVGLGFPKQEKLITQLLPELPDAWFLGIGAGIDFLAGSKARAPVTFQRLGLEWLYRLQQEPRRLAHRYLIVDLPYALRLLARSTVAGFRRRR